MSKQFAIYSYPSHLRQF